MAIRTNHTLSPAALDADGVITSATLTSGAQTLNGALVSGGIATLDSNGMARRVYIASDGNDSGVTFTVTGKNWHGDSFSETITGPNATSVISDSDFKTVTAVSISGNSTGNITVGTGAKLSGPWIPLDMFRNPFGVGFGCIISSGGSLTYSVEHTFNDIQASVTAASTVAAVDVFAHEDVAAKTVSADGNYAFEVPAIRTTITAFTSGTLNFKVNQ